MEVANNVMDTQFQLNQVNIDSVIDTDEEDDEQLESNSSEHTDVLNTLALEQVKLFLTSEKNFFTSSLIENVALLALSKNSMKTTHIQQIVSDVLLTFSLVSKNIIRIEKRYGQILEHSILDDLIIKSVNTISDRIIADSIQYSSYLARQVFDEVRESQDFYAETHVNKTLEDEYNKLFIRDIEPTEEYIQQLQSELQSKNKMLNVIQSVQMITEFVSVGANKCKDINEYFKEFANVADNVSAVISEVIHNENSGITSQEVYNDKFYDTIIKSKGKHIQTGLSSFDSITNGGFEKDRIYLLSGKTGGGKSTILINLAHGMVKSCSGLFLPDVYILSKLSDQPSLIKPFTEYFKNNINNIISINSKEDGIEVASKKHVVLYMTLENMEDETMKRYMSRIGLIPNVFWLLLDRDPVLSQHIKEYGFNFKYDDLPVKMNTKLKNRLIAITTYYDLLINQGRSILKVVWREAYSIDTYDILNEVKKLEHDNYIVDSVIVDYPDKLKPITSTITKGDQSWDALGKVIDNLKGLSKKVGAPVIAVSQFTRQGNKDSGNKNTVIKAGNTSGSQQKEYNSDMLINSNIHSKSDTELSNHHTLFKNSQRLINQNKLALSDNLFSSFESNKKLNTSNSFNDKIQESIDIMQLCQSIPDLQTMTNYIVKNRDGISDLTFDCYILYGLYFVSDFDEETLLSAQFAIDTHLMILDYMNECHLIDKNSLDMVKKLTDSFIERLNTFKEEIAESSKNKNGSQERWGHFGEF